VKPHDLRRTYAKLFYEAGGDLVALQQNLGHASINTTIKYIGDRDIDKRRAPAILAFDLSQLNGKH
jgi:integrase